MLTVKDIMIHNVYSVHKNDVVRTVLEKFAQLRISGAPIVDDKNQLVGYISDGDIMRYLGKHFDQGFTSWISMFGYYYGMNYDLQTEQSTGKEHADEFKENALYVCNLNVLNVGVKKIVTVKEDDDLIHVAEILSKRKFKKVPVVRNNGLVGIVSRGDVVRAVVQRFLPLENE